MTNRLINYINFFILALIIGTQSYNLFYTRHDSFSGVWLVRSVILVLITSFVGSFVIGAFFHIFPVDQLPSCASVAYFRFRWYIFVMAALALCAIPIYFAILQANHRQTRLLLLLGSQIQVNLFMVLLTIGIDALSRFLYLRQLSQAQAQAQTQSQPQTETQDRFTQFGYFSPKSHGPPPLSTSVTQKKNPFESGKFRFAR